MILTRENSEASRAFKNIVASRLQGEDVPVMDLYPKKGLGFWSKIKTAFRWKVIALFSLFQAVLKEGVLLSNRKE